MKRGVLAALVVLAWSAPTASGDARVMLMDDGGGSAEDVYVCVDPSTESPGVYVSSTDCASGTTDTATVRVKDATTGTELVIHLKSCLERCVHRPCATDPCDPGCLLRAACAHARCVAGACARCAFAGPCDDAAS